MNRLIVILMIGLVLMCFMGCEGCRSGGEGCRSSNDPNGVILLDPLGTTTVLPAFPVAIESVIEIIDTDFEIITNEPNLLVVELWDEGGWYMNSDKDMKVLTLRQVKVTNLWKYDITLKPRHLLVQKKKEKEQ